MEPEQPGSATAGLADRGICDCCLAELFAPRDRRHRHPFISCSDCGPRFSIARELPFAREHSTMAPFAPCAACEYERADPSSRRFQDELICCAACGPKLALEAPHREPAPGEGGLREAIALLATGGLLAFKGTGGYQIACDANDPRAVARLRERKQRPDQPLAIVARELAALEPLVELDGAGREALSSLERPILLARKRDPMLLAELAPRLGELGVRLAASPLEHLLLAGSARGDPRLLAVTAGTLGGEPIAKDDADARLRLGPICDALLLHDRAIQNRAVDSLVRVVAGAIQPVRRARGFAPEPIALPLAAPCVLAVGAQERNTICIASGGEALLSQHLGSLEAPLARAALTETVDRFERWMGGAKPSLIAHDLQTDCASTRWAQARGVPLIAVQHHHAHIASCLAENGTSAQAIGVALCGGGMGPGGELWGGEILRANLSGFSRLGHFRRLNLLGGEAAALREPWRLGLAALLDAGEPIELLDSIEPETRARAAAALTRGIRSPNTSSAGCWLDAIAALLGVRARTSWPQQASLELEALAMGAERNPDEGAPPFPAALDDGAVFQIDLRPAIRELCGWLRARADRGWLALRVFETFAAAVEAACVRARAGTQLTQVALSGGCFESRLLTERCFARLSDAGFTVLLHREVPPGDGGLALGQAAIAAMKLRGSSPGVPRPKG